MLKEQRLYRNELVLKHMKGALEEIERAQNNVNSFAYKEK